MKSIFGWLILLAACGCENTRADTSAGGRHDPDVVSYENGRVEHGESTSAAYTLRVHN